MSDLSWKLIGKEVVFSSTWFNVTKNAAILPRGITIDDYYVVDNKDAVMILPLDADNNIVIKSEFRLPVNQVLFELPAGAVENTDSDLLEAAKRELREETGFVSDNWIYLGESFDCPDRCTGRLNLFFAKDVERKETQHLDKTEEISWTTVPLNAAVKMCMEGRIKVNSCIHLILKAKYLLESTNGL